MNPQGSARIAIVGAASPAGALLREALAADRFPSERLELFLAEPQLEGEAVLSEYDGEPRLVQSSTVSEIADFDVIFLCESGSVARQVSQEVTAPSVVLDLARAAAQPTSEVVHLEINPDQLRPETKQLGVAHPLSALIAELVYPLERELDLEQVVAMIVRPASDFGEKGIIELREQVVRLLNFTDLPTETFGRQLAFNVLNQEQVGAEAPGLEAQVAQEVSGLLGWAEPRLSVRMMTAPIFYGHCVQLHLRTTNKSRLSDVQEALARSRFTDPPSEQQAATPLELAQENRLSLSPPTEDGMGGYWLWASAGEAAARGARHAVRLARAVADL